MDMVVRSLPANGPLHDWHGGDPLLQLLDPASARAANFLRQVRQVSIKYPCIHQTAFADNMWKWACGYSDMPDLDDNTTTADRVRSLPRNGGDMRNGSADVRAHKKAALADIRAIVKADAKIYNRTIRANRQRRRRNKNACCPPEMSDAALANASSKRKLVWTITDFERVCVQCGMLESCVPP